MFGKTYGFRSTAAAVAATLWGMAPLAAQAIGAPQIDLVTVASPEGSGCAPPMAGGEPFTIAAEPRSESVKAAPFSGVGTTEIVTTLADGNRIVRTNTMKYYRDSRGRTRTEYSLAAIGPFTPDQAQSVVMITDPIEGKRYVLNSAKKRADIFPLLEFRTAKAATGENRATGSATKEVIADGPSAKEVAGSSAAPSVGVVKGGNVMYGVQAFAAGPGIAAATVTRGAPQPLRGAGPMGPTVMVMSNVASLPPANAGFIMQYAPAGADGCKPNAKPLPAPTSTGERIIEGLKVTGTRMEFTIPSGAVGNEQPIVVSSEQWFSPELGVVVSSTHRDPMMGDTSYKLEQITRTEPDAALFAVPADYTQTDLTNGGGDVFFESGVGVGPPGAPPPGAATLRMRGAPALPASGAQKQGQ
jgi:hypothetical protein